MAERDGDKMTDSLVGAADFFVNVLATRAGALFFAEMGDGFIFIRTKKFPALKAMGFIAG